ncbi:MULTISPECIES: MmgE/PrpD family protein [Streptomyces]|uniref:MmgE/PrpD family protein n=1 Tax=Streptomyces lycopersici TaxID=2974589 RepID=UPI0021CFFF0F|nr:MmgE/PrpD family protein [Streptomyces sp. NEAU-383]
MNAARQLGEWVASVSEHEFPDDLLRKAADHLLDTLGAIVAGHDAPPARVARAVFARPGPVPVVGRAETLDLRDAAYVHAVAAHSLEIDDTEGCDHSGAVVVPVLWSLLHGLRNDGGRTGAAHAAVFPAMIVGYEVGRRIQLSLGGYEAHNAKGWHSTATCGVFAAAAAAAVLLGLDAEQTCAALGIAASAASGTWVFAADGAMTKQFHPGNAARAGLEAALLTEHGASGPAEVFEDVWGGFLRVYGGADTSPETLLADLGSVWHFRHSAIKPYAACRSAHSAIDALRDILDERGLHPDQISLVRLHVSDFLRPMICPPAPRDAAQARMSLPVSAALLLEGAALMPDDFNAFDAPRVQTRLRRIEVVRDADEHAEPLVEVHSANAIHRKRIAHARGGEESPLPSDEVRRKFSRLCDPILGEEATGRLTALVDELETSARRRGAPSEADPVV